MSTTGPLQQQLTVQVDIKIIVIVIYNIFSYISHNNYYNTCLLSLGTTCWNRELHFNTGVLIVYITLKSS